MRVCLATSAALLCLLVSSYTLSASPLFRRTPSRVLPLYGCELLLRLCLTALAFILSAFDAIDAHPCIDLVRMPLIDREGFSRFPHATVGAFERRAFSLFSSYACFAKPSPILLAPPLRRKLVFVLHKTAACTLRTRHVLVFDSFPVNVLPAQRLQ